MKATTLPLVIALAGLVPIAADASPGKATLETVLARHFEAQGGLDRLKAVKSISYTMTDTNDGKTATTTVTRARPNLMRFERTEGAATTIKAFDGSAGWVSSEGKIEMMTGEKLAGMKAKPFDDALVDPAASSAKVELAGSEDVAGAPAYLVKVSYANGNSETRYIDAKTALEVKRVVAFTHEGKSGTKTIAFRDYKPVNGIMTAMTRDYDADGKKGTSTMTRVEYDGALKLSQFAPPAAPATAVSAK